MPKGVMIEHRNITGICQQFSTDWGLTNRMWSVSLQASAFVASVYGHLQFPGIRCNHGDHTGIQTKNIDLIVRFYQEKHITITFLPPHMVHEIYEVR